MKNSEHGCKEIGVYIHTKVWGGERKKLHKKWQEKNGICKISKCPFWEEMSRSCTWKKIGIFGQSAIDFVFLRNLDKGKEIKGIYEWVLKEHSQVWFCKVSSISNCQLNAKKCVGWFPRGSTFSKK